MATAKVLGLTESPKKDSKFHASFGRSLVAAGVIILVLIQFHFGRIVTQTPQVVHDDSPRAVGPGSANVNHYVPRTDSRYPFCSRLISSSTSLLWKQQLQNETLHASYPTKGRYAHNTEIQEWVNHLHSFYTPERLRRSISNRASTSAIRRILQILSDYPTTREPLHILVSGGSVTAGRYCNENPIGITVEEEREHWASCAWPTRLEKLWNDLFFGGERVVHVSNMATGGSSSDVAALVLEYQLFPKDEQPIPHIVLIAHSANDAQHPNVDDELFFQHMQDIVVASHKLRYCDNDLPLVVMIDDFYGYRPSTSIMMEQTARVYAIASWFGLMSVNYGNIVRHDILGRYVNETFKEPLMGSHYNLHMGMGLHIGMSWAVMFNFLNEFVEACHDAEDEGLEPTELVQDWWPNKSLVLDLEELGKRRPPSKYIGYLKKDNQSTAGSIVREWKDRVVEKEGRCQNSVSEPGRACDYAWMVNRITKVFRPSDIDREMNRVLVHTDGWVAKGKPVKQPRTGWYAEKENATFALKIHVSESSVNVFTMLTMKSYGPKFAGTKLMIDVRVQRQRNASVGQKEEKVYDDQASYEISGHQTVKTSVHVPHKFPIPGNGASVNDTILLNATLVGGNYFKIAGMAFCRY